MIYHTVTRGYLRYVGTRGFKYGHIYTCPPRKGQNYIFPFKPDDQKEINTQRLRKWYADLLTDGISGTSPSIRGFENVGDAYKKPTLLDIPYFEGDNWPDIMEDILKLDNRQREEEETLVNTKEKVRAEALAIYEESLKEWETQTGIWAPFDAVKEAGEIAVAAATKAKQNYSPTGNLYGPVLFAAVRTAQAAAKVKVAAEAVEKAAAEEAASVARAAALAEGGGAAAMDEEVPEPGDGKRVRFSKPRCVVTGGIPHFDQMPVPKARKRRKSESSTRTPKVKYTLEERLNMVIQTLKRDFLVVELCHNDSDEPVPEDPDLKLKLGGMPGDHTCASFLRAEKLEFSTLRQAKYSTMMLLHVLMMKDGETYPERFPDEKEHKDILEDAPADAEEVEEEKSEDEDGEDDAGGGGAAGDGSSVGGGGAAAADGADAMATTAD